METWWETIAGAVRQDFSDLPDLRQATHVILRLGMAALLGGLLGYERELAGKSAGIRTHILVALGAALFVVVPIQAGAGVADLTRVLQGLVAGVGFLGAGTILKVNQPAEIHGLTTAAGIWLTAAVGVACGMGREASAVLSTILALAVLHVLPEISGWFHRRRGAQDHTVHQ